MCSIQAVSISNDGDTILFRLYHEDPTRPFKFSPFNLVGVEIIHDTVYRPIYHGLKFDNLNDAE